MRSPFFKILEWGFKTQFFNTRHKPDFIRVYWLIVDPVQPSRAARAEWTAAQRK